MFKAILERDSHYEGIFVFGVKTTGVFCRPTCRARKPNFKNVAFFKSAADALAEGYRPCKICTPMAAAGDFPEWMVPLTVKISEEEDGWRFSDGNIRGLGLDPNRVRRWFKRNYGITFQAYLRSRRVGRAFDHLSKGGKVIDAAFEHGYESLSGFTQAFKNLVGASPRTGNNGEAIHVCRIPSPLGPLIAGATGRGVCLLEFSDRGQLKKEIERLQIELKGPVVTSLNPHLLKLRLELEEYFCGRRKAFDVPLVTPGTAFQKKVWSALKAIPYGETRTYLEQAVALGNRKSVRAVARANGANRIVILIPCHRVVGKNGAMVGYTGGVRRKWKLLEIEKRATA